jgi:hypothetical protein
VHDLETKGGEYKIRLLQTLKRWSNIFQHILFARQIHTLDKEIYDLFKLHLIDEFGHDNFFSDFIYDFDPKLEGYFSWFINQMSILPDNEKLIVTNLVLESAANIFYSKFSKKCEENKNINQYIDLHNQLDKDHASLGMENIRKYCFENQISANSILDSSWKMFISMFSRIREISLGSDDDLSFLDENRTPSKTRKS